MKKWSQLEAEEYHVPEEQLQLILDNIKKFSTATKF